MNSNVYFRIKFLSTNRIPGPMPLSWCLLLTNDSSTDKNRKERRNHSLRRTSCERGWVYRLYSAVNRHVVLEYGFVNKKWRRHVLITANNRQVDSVGIARSKRVTAPMSKKYIISLDGAVSPWGPIPIIGAHIKDSIISLLARPHNHLVLGEILSICQKLIWQSRISQEPLYRQLR